MSSDTKTPVKTNLHSSDAVGEGGAASPASASPSASPAAASASAFLEQKKVREMLNDAVMAMLRERCDDPRAFLCSYFGGGSTAGAPASGIHRPAPLSAEATQTAVTTEDVTPPANGGSPLATPPLPPFIQVTESASVATTPAATPSAGAAVVVVGGGRRQVSVSMREDCFDVPPPQANAMGSSMNTTTTTSGLRSRSIALSSTSHAADFIDKAIDDDIIGNRYDGMLAEVKVGVCAQRRRETPGVLPVNIGARNNIANTTSSDGCSGDSPDTATQWQPFGVLMAYLSAMVPSHHHQVLLQHSGCAHQQQHDMGTRRPSVVSTGSRRAADNADEDDDQPLDFNGGADHHHANGEGEGEEEHSDQPAPIHRDYAVAKAVVSLLSCYAVAAVAKEEFQSPNHRHLRHHEHSGSDTSPDALPVSPSRTSIVPTATTRAGIANNNNINDNHSNAAAADVEEAMKEEILQKRAALADRVSTLCTLLVADGPHAKHTFIAFLLHVLTLLGDNGGLAASSSSSISGAAYTADSILPDVPEDGGLGQLCQLLYPFPGSDASASACVLSGGLSHFLGALLPLALSDTSRMLCDLMTRLAWMDAKGWLPDSEWLTVGSFFLFSYDESQGPSALRAAMGDEAEGGAAPASASAYAQPLWYLIGGGSAAAHHQPLQRRLGAALTYALEARYREPLEVTTLSSVGASIGGGAGSTNANVNNPCVFLAAPLLQVGATRADGYEADLFIKARTLIAMGDKEDDRRGITNGGATVTATTTSMQAHSGPHHHSYGVGGATANDGSAENTTASLNGTQTYVGEAPASPAGVSHHSHSSPSHKAGGAPSSSSAPSLTLAALPEVTAQVWDVIAQYRAVSGLPAIGIETFIGVQNAVEAVRLAASSGAAISDSDGTAVDATTPSRNILTPTPVTPPPPHLVGGGTTPESKAHDLPAFGALRGGVATAADGSGGAASSAALNVRSGSPFSAGGTTGAAGNAYVPSLLPHASTAVGLRYHLASLPTRELVALLQALLTAEELRAGHDGGDVYVFSCDPQGARLGRWITPGVHPEGWRGGMRLVGRILINTNTSGASSSSPPPPPTYRQLLRHALGQYYANTNADAHARGGGDGRPAPSSGAATTTSSADLSTSEMFLIKCLQKSLRYMATDPVQAGPQQRVYGVGRGANNFVRRPGGGRYGKSEVVMHKLISAASFNSSAQLRSGAQSVFAPGKVVYFPGPILGTASTAVKSWVKTQLSVAESRALRSHDPIRLLPATPLMGACGGEEGLDGGDDCAGFPSAAEGSALLSPSSNSLVFTLHSSSALLLGNYCHLPRSHDCILGAAAPISVRDQRLEVEVGDVNPLLNTNAAAMTAAAFASSSVLHSNSTIQQQQQPLRAPSANPLLLHQSHSFNNGNNPSSFGARRGSAAGGVGGVGVGCPVIRLVEIDDTAALQLYLRSLLKACPSAQSCELVWQLLHGRVALEISGSVAPSSSPLLSSSPLAPIGGGATDHHPGGGSVSMAPSPIAINTTTTINSASSPLNWMLKHKSVETSFREVLSVWGLVIDEGAAEEAWEAFVTQVEGQKSAVGTAGPLAAGASPLASASSPRHQMGGSIVLDGSPTSFTTHNNSPHSTVASPPPSLLEALTALKADAAAASAVTSQNLAMFTHSTHSTVMFFVYPLQLQRALRGVGVGGGVNMGAISRYVWLDAATRKGQLVTRTLGGGVGEEPLSVRKASTHPSQRRLQITDADVSFVCHHLLPLALPAASITISHSDTVTDAICEELFAALCGDGNITRMSLKGCRISRHVQEEVDALTAAVRRGAKGELSIPHLDEWVEEWGRNGLRNQLILTSPCTSPTLRPTDAAHAHARSNCGARYFVSPTALPISPPVVVGGSGDANDLHLDDMNGLMSPSTLVYAEPPMAVNALAALGRAVGRLPSTVRRLSIAGGKDVTLAEVFEGLVGHGAASAAAANTSRRGGDGSPNPAARRGGGGGSAASSSGWHSIDTLAITNVAILKVSDDADSEGDGALLPEALVANAGACTNAADVDGVSPLGLPVSSALLTLLATAPSLTTMTFSSLTDSNVPMSVVGAITEAWRRRELEVTIDGKEVVTAEDEALLAEASRTDGLGFASSQLRHLVFADCDVDLDVVAYLAASVGPMTMGGAAVVGSDAADADHRRRRSSSSSVGGGGYAPKTASSILFTGCYFPPVNPTSNLFMSGAFSTASTPSGVIMTPSMQHSGISPSLALSQQVSGGGSGVHIAAVPSSCAVSVGGGGGGIASPTAASAMDYLNPYLERLYAVGVRLEFRGCDGVPDTVVDSSA